MNDHLDAANLGLAWALFKQGRESDALPLIQALIKSKGGSAAGQQAQLLMAKIELAKKQFKEAIASLEALLATQPEKGVAFETDYWLGEAYAANGQPDRAVTAYQRVTGDPQAFPKLRVAQAWLGLGRAQRALRQNDQAMLAYEQTYHLTENETTRLEAFQSYLECARASGQLPEAVAKLQEFAKTTDPSAPAALFAIGSVLAENREDDKAIGILESLLVAYGTSPWVPAANEQLGQLYARTGKPGQAIQAFKNCIATSADPALVRAARSQLGAVLLNQTKDYAGAAAQFAQISDGTDPAAENAAYNFLMAQAWLGKLDAFTKPEADFEKRFPKSSHLKSLALAKGQLLAGAGKTDDAKAVYQNAIAGGGTGGDQVALLNALANLQYQTGDLEGTYATCKTIADKPIADQFPADALAAAQRGVLVSYELKKLTEDQVETALVDLAQKYKNVPGAPEAYFRLGEFYFYRQDYVRAQDAFQQLTANYPASSYADNAYFFAGRAAYAHQDYAAARSLLEKVPDSSPLKPDARLWEGRVYQQQLNFDQANAFSDAVLATEKSGPRFVEASLLKGQCLFALGAKDPANYALAQAAFDQILKSKDGTIAQRNEAAVRSGKCLEKMGHTDEAMKLYLDVLYGRVAGDDSTSPLRPSSPGSSKPAHRPAASGKRRRTGAGPSRSTSGWSRSAARTRSTSTTWSTSCAAIITSTSRKGPVNTREKTAADNVAIATDDVCADRQAPLRCFPPTMKDRTRDQAAAWAETASSDAHDKALMVRIAAGDEVALRDLIEKHQGAVYGTIAKMLGDPVEAQDLAQQVFVRIYRAAGSYRAAAQFKTWMFTIVRNLVFNEHRRRSRVTLVALHAPGKRVEPLGRFGRHRPARYGEQNPRRVHAAAGNAAQNRRRNPGPAGTAAAGHRPAPLRRIFLRTNRRNSQNQRAGDQVAPVPGTGNAADGFARLP